MAEEIQPAREAYWEEPALGVVDGERAEVGQNGHGMLPALVCSIAICEA